MQLMSFDLIESVALVVHGKQSPTDEEWESYLKWTDRNFKRQNGFLPTLVITSGGGPTIPQRKSVGALAERQKAEFPGKSSPVAIMTQSKIIRGTITALNWFNTLNKMAAFAPDAYHDVAEFLSISQPTMTKLRIRAGVLQEKVKLSA